MIIVIMIHVKFLIDWLTGPLSPRAPDLGKQPCTGIQFELEGVGIWLPFSEPSPALKDMWSDEGMNGPHVVLSKPFCTVV